jgi:hypothetical protein
MTHHQTSRSRLTRPGAWLALAILLAVAAPSRASIADFGGTFSGKWKTEFFGTPFSGSAEIVITPKPKGAASVLITWNYQAAKFTTRGSVKRSGRGSGKITSNKIPTIKGTAKVKAPGSRKLNIVAEGSVFGADGVADLTLKKKSGDRVEVSGKCTQSFLGGPPMLAQTVEFTGRKTK